MLLRPLEQFVEHRLERPRALVPLSDRALEVFGALLILTPSLAAFGALLLIGIMIGATVTHLFVIGGTAVPALLLLALSAIVAYAKRGQLASLGRML